VHGAGAARRYTPPVTALTSLPAIVLVAGWLSFAVAVAAISRWVVRHLVPVDERDHVPGIAAPLMPALGAAFAILMALTLSSEAGYLRAAQDLVSNEAGEASRLAWAATGPGVGTAPIQAALLDYLQLIRDREWQPLGADEGHDPDVAKALASLERAVRLEAVRPELGTPTSTELLASLDLLTTGRRARIAAASRELPLLYVITLVASGVALIANAGVLTYRSSLRTSLLVVGLAGVVGLSLALLFALSGPWEGALTVSGQPIDTIVRDLRDGFFQATAVIR
jgi:hypothetical protein